jgi:hypothetical protein
MVNARLALVSLVSLVSACTPHDPPAPPILMPATVTAIASTTAAPKEAAPKDPAVALKDPAAASAAQDGSVWSTLRPAAGLALAAQLSAEVSKARALHLEPGVYLGASWCKPCIAIKKYHRDPLMLEAFKGTYLIELDLDDWKAPEIEAMGFTSREVPHFYKVDAAGHAVGRTITSNVWGDDVPANMAPPLKRFFSAP